MLQPTNDVLATLKPTAKSLIGGLTLEEAMLDRLPASHLVLSPPVPYLCSPSLTIRHCFNPFCFLLLCLYTLNVHFTTN